MDRSFDALTLKGTVAEKFRDRGLKERHLLIQQSKLHLAATPVTAVIDVDINMGGAKSLSSEV